ncbi:putative secreted protein [Wickerhamomyces ciferrii]|uniref:Secreted protein n=1 Tax=Wickerhamomyces ciferrii (strain ATCC 14091 / BCRC 22168 / CBS 111 / JCM 3599 / NBRC 0793 / NRRL Y-1031 F-60-10) TaxID=1206466 RepID=K0L0J8_WICCF|nr:uncharacterized protein BN7_6569 [Wickerhamomyces ciferrii]CCH46963.1 putative secreted protein [Wickerhamomyces ciferrii]
MKFTLPLLALSSLLMKAQAQAPSASYSVSCPSITPSTESKGVTTTTFGDTVLIYTEYHVTSYFDTCNGNSWTPTSIRTETTTID